MSRSGEIRLCAIDTAIRRMVDPAATLPEVELRVFEEIDFPGDFRREKADILHDGQTFGWCDLITEHRDRKMHFDLINLDADRGDSRNLRDMPKRERPKGLGLAAYLIAIETAHSRGLPFESQDGYLSIGSNRIWEILAERGVATVVKPAKHYNRGDSQKVIAKYRAEVV